MALIDNLVSYWKMDEVSGNRADSHGSNTLTDVNTVGSTTGIINNGADFIAANTERLTRSAQTWGISNASSVSLWAFTDNLAANPRVVQFGTGGANTSSITILFQNVSTGFFYVDLRSSSGSTGKIYKFLPASVSSLRHYVYTWDGTDFILYENGSAVTPTKDSDGALSMTDSSRALAIGSTTAGTAPLDGTVDEVGLWSRALSASEVSELYNGGAGLAYPFSAGAAPTPTLMMLGVGS